MSMLLGFRTSSVTWILTSRPGVNLVRAGMGLAYNLAGTRALKPYVCRVIDPIHLKNSKKRYL